MRSIIREMSHNAFSSIFKLSRKLKLSETIMMIIIISFITVRGGFQKWLIEANFLDMAM